MAWRIIALLAAFLRVVWCLQSFKLEPQYTEVNPGDTAVLHCRVFNMQGQCSWQKDGYPIGPEQSKYEWAASPEQGDCSLRVLGADVKYDDGSWSCQVTASSFQTQDALRSEAARLVVRVEPETPEVRFAGALIPSGHNLTARLADELEVECTAGGGNPPALMRWSIGEDDLSESSSQQNVSVATAGSALSWTAVSVLRHKFRRRQAGAYLRCVALHQAFETGTSDTIVRLDLQYPPAVTLSGRPEQQLEASVDVVVLQCHADANPAASVSWTFTPNSDAGDAQSKTVSVERLELRPVSRKNAGEYTCRATNELGTSEPSSVSLDIKYAPHIYRVNPPLQVTARLYNTTEMMCQAEGSPAPSYYWQRRRPAAAGPHPQTRSSRFTFEVVPSTGGRLLLENVTYQSQAQYVCVATNQINGHERSDHSVPVELRVTGGPQILRKPSGGPVGAENAAQLTESGGQHTESTGLTVTQGQDAALDLVFCSDPMPTRVVWQLPDGQRLQTGHTAGRYKADDIDQTAEDCYLTRLWVRGTRTEDATDYFLIVQNEMGTDRHGVTLTVKGVPVKQKSLARPVLIALGCGGLLLLLLLLVVLISVCRRRHCCCSQKGDFKPSDIDGEKSVVVVGAIPPDALYSGPKKAPPITGDYELGVPSTEISASDGNIIYADLMLPRASNNGSMRKHGRRRDQGCLVLSGGNRTEYAEIQFSDSGGSSEAAERTPARRQDEGRQHLGVGEGDGVD